MKQLRTVLKKYRLSRADVDIALNGRNGKRPHALAGRKLEPNFRNPANKQAARGGRDQKPKWLSRR